VAIATRLVAIRSNPPAASSTQRMASGHPCSHGYYVSQAAHARKGGKYVSGVAQSNLGKDGSCSAPLPSRAPTSTKGSGD
jgi:hypothetical protein